MQLPKIWEIETSGVDYLSPDSSIAIEVQVALDGVRHFRSATLQLARALTDHPSIQIGILVVLDPEISIRRIQDEWAFIRAILVPPLLDRLAIAVKRTNPLGEHEVWLDPNTPEINQLLQEAESLTKSDLERRARKASSKSIGRHYYEAVKILLVRWLQKEGPISIGDLARAVGCSYPTIRFALKRLEDNRYLKRWSHRAVELSQFPTEVWQQLLALRHTLRPQVRFIDASGDRSDPVRLMKRFESINPANVAIGGVVAARYWHRDFDLNGMPRLDLITHGPLEKADLDFVRRLDGALEASDDPEAYAPLVIHSLIRHSNLFVQEHSPVLIADPVETALDLNDLGLTQQAAELFAHFRKDARSS